ncbi:bile acid:sodium symporter family protein [Anaerovibrio sp.]|uniref:bile acid:sodium symporter family protein n=1 Tax=Anaerovibrio sp. TaxID=1872532 RepID=UPI0025C140D8|nr:bile acid:sodium symporter family protein [Anaerovibrio sp.]
MKALKGACDFLVSNMSLMVFLIGVFAVWQPEALTWVGPHIPLLLGIIMFGMGMTLTVDDFKNILRNPKGIFIGVFAQFLIMPAVAFGLVKAFALPPEIAIGVILVGTCPGGTASNVIAFLARGDVALSVSMSATSTLLAPLVTPILTYLLADAVIDVSVSSMMMSIVKMVLLPVLLGLAVHHFFDDFSRKINPFMPVLSAVTVVLTVGGVVSLSAAKLLDVGLLMFAVVICHNSFGLLLGYLLAKAFRMDETKSRTISIEVGMQNSGMAASLAVMYFDPVAAIPGAIFSVWHNVSGAILANFFAKHSEADEADSVPELV